MDTPIACDVHGERRSPFVLVHGSWHDGAVWGRVAARLRQEGRVVHAPTLAGMSVTEPRPGPDVGLHAHVDQVQGVLERERLSDAILVGHSYAGLVIAMVADRAPERVRALVYLDAFIPADGESLYDLSPGLRERLATSLTDESGRTLRDGADNAWLLPPPDPAAFGVEDAEDQRWLREGHMAPTPELTFAERVTLRHREPPHPAVFICCTRFGMQGPERRARERGYPIHLIDAGHDAMVTAPAEVASLLLERCIDRMPQSRT